MYSNAEILKYLQDQGRIDPDTIQCEMQMAEKTKYLDMHPYEIWKGSDESYCTYFPDETAKDGRVRRKSKDKKNLENLIIKFWKEKEEKVTVEDVFNEWNDRRLRLNQISHATYDRNVRVFKRHFTALRKREIKNLTVQEISDFLEEEIADKKLSAKSFSNLKGIAKGFLKRAQTRGLIKFSVNQMMMDLDLSDSCFSRNEKVDEDDVFTEKEFIQLSSYLKEHPDIWNLGIMLILSSGVRVGELVTLKWSDFLDETYTQFRVNRTETYHSEPDPDSKKNSKKHTTMKNVYEVKESPKTLAGRRIVTIPDECIWILKELRKINPFGEYIFMRDGKRMTANTIRARLYRVCEKIGIQKKSPHKGRKAYASILLDHGVDNAFIIAQLGHTDISCTETYYHKDRKSNATKSAIVNSIPEFNLLAK